MGDTWLIILELLKVILLLALFPAQIAWPMLTSGHALKMLLGVGIIIGVYGGLITAVVRGLRGLIIGQVLQRPRARRRRTRSRSRAASGPL